MATSSSLGAISRRLCRSLLETQRPFCYHGSIPKSWFSTGPSALDYNSDMDEASTLNLYPKSSDSASGESFSASSSPEQTRQRVVSEYALEGGLDVGIYKVIYFCFLIFFWAISQQMSFDSEYPFAITFFSC